MVVPVRRRLRTKTPPAAAQRVPSMGAVRRRRCSKVPGPGYPGGGNRPDDLGPPVSQGRPHHPPGLPLQPSGDPPDDGGDGGDSGGDSEDDDGDEPDDTDLDCKQHGKPPEDPDSSGDGGGRGRRGRHQTPLTINKWAKPLPKLDLPPRIHLQKASKVKQIWELSSVNVALAMSTWNDLLAPGLYPE